MSMTLLIMGILTYYYIP
jgi:hypothetical protein